MQVEQLVFQPTTFCNLDCSYCYLPGRDQRRRMDPETVFQTVRRLGEEGLLAEAVDVRWHCGEPMAAGLSFYEDVLNAEEWRRWPNVVFEHSIQTNGTLLTDKWITFLETHAFRVGVSLDGPAELHDRFRLDRSGRPSHQAAERSVLRLIEAGVETEALAVITGHSLGDANRFYDYFAALGLRLLKLNVEETEGIHSSMSSRDSQFGARYRQWLDALYVRHLQGDLKIRELLEIESFLVSSEDQRRCLMVEPLAIVSIDVAGGYSTYSPELIGMTHEDYPSFVLGSVYDECPLATGLRNGAGIRIHRAIESGVSRCQLHCEYFTMCGGGSPSNKLFENGSFSSTETFYCQQRIQAVADVVLDRQLESMSRA